jgi:hypothetical protein
MSPPFIEHCIIITQAGQSKTRKTRVISVTKVVIDMTMSLTGFVAGPGDGKNDGMRIFDLLGDGVSLFDHLGGPVRLEKISAADGPLATHLRYRVLKA